MTTDYGRVNAPDFPADADWLNTDRPLRLADFAGKLLLLDFWTYCCINCMHLLPTLRRLESEFPEELAVVECTLQSSTGSAPRRTYARP